MMDRKINPLSGMRKLYWPKVLTTFLPECCSTRIREFLSKYGVLLGFDAGVSHVCFTLCLFPAFALNFRKAS